MPPTLYHWRTAGGAEVDLILELDRRLFPAKVKASSRLSGHALRGLRAFRATYGERVAAGLVIYAGREVYWPSRDVLAVPWFWL